MRELTSHKVNGCNDDLKIEVNDEPGHGGACHEYAIVNTNPKDDPGCQEILASICFQNGPIAEVGTNGVTHEALLAILIDRLEGFQYGPYKCEPNELALSHCKAAQAALKARTAERLARGVEGTHKV